MGVGVYMRTVRDRGVGVTGRVSSVVVLAALVPRSKSRAGMEAVVALLLVIVHLDR